MVADDSAEVVPGASGNSHGNATPRKVEARTSTDPGSDPRKRRLAVEQTQQRADAGAAPRRTVALPGPSGWNRSEMGSMRHVRRPVENSASRIELSVAQSARAPADP